MAHQYHLLEVLHHQLPQRLRLIMLEMDPEFQAVEVGTPTIMDGEEAVDPQDLMVAAVTAVVLRLLPAAAGTAVVLLLLSAAEDTAVTPIMAGNHSP